MDAIHALLGQLVGLIGIVGYEGVFILTFLESTFVPIPSELVVIPAGYLAQQGHFNIWVLLTVTTLGTLTGSLFNYFIAYTLGRKLLVSYGKYMFMPKERFEKVEHFFKEHGSVSVFSGRLVLGVRHFIAFPAGLAKMSLEKFCFYTTMGGLLWMAALLLLGFVIGQEKTLIDEYLQIIQAAAGVFVILLLVSYGWCYSKRKDGGVKVRMANIQPANDALVRSGKNPAKAGKEGGPRVRMANIEPSHEAMEMLSKGGKKGKAKKAKKGGKKTTSKKRATKKPVKKGRKRGGKK